MDLRIRLASFARVAAAVSCGLAFVVAGAHAAPSDGLRARYAALAPELANNPFHRPIHIESSQSSGDLQGEVFAVVNHPFATVDAAMQGAERWCEVLILPFNIKQCQASGAAPSQKLSLFIGRKHDQPVSDAYQVDFDYRLAAAAPDYLKVQMSAGAGPMGTHDYRIAFEAIPLDAGHSFLHISYAYGYGLAARVAMQGYLSTVGRGKVGFSVVDSRADGQPVYVDNVRGVIERNTMRYYLAVDAYLDSLSASPQQQVERRLHTWFSATERYPRQLHEIDEAEYLAMKRKEILRQRPDLQTAKAN